MKEGIEKIRNGDNITAIEDFTKIIDLQPENYQSYYYRANAKFNRRDGKGALADYNKSIEMKPDFADAFYNRAFCKQFLNDKDGACNDWNKAAALGRPNVKDLLNVCK
jgi:tetratricopeptide (TPR) repeat protein